jgi:GT2 family glycosyltransferase
MIYVILLNWNGWKDTLHCLESLFHSDYQDFRVIVCDNDSTDGSMEKLKAWAEGRLPVEERLNEALDPLVFPPVSKPVSYIEYNREEAESGGNPGDTDCPLVLIQTGSNGGFAAGNNVGIRYVLNREAEYIWLLNNDTVVKANTLKELVYRTESEANFGVSGAVIYFASNPKRTQTYGGGRLSRLTGRDRFIDSPERMDYVTGTSLFVRREVFEQVGLLDEAFFFYWEDVDFSRRVKDVGWQLVVAANAVVYHKFSSTVGGQSLRSDLYKVSSLTRYFKKHYKYWYIFPVGFNISGMLLNRLIRRQFDRIGPILKETHRSIRKK